MDYCPGPLHDSHQTDFGTIDRYDKLGRLLTDDERMKQAKQRGLCYPCGRPTHAKRRFMANVAITNDDVFNGTCIKCHPDKVPKHVLEEWEQRNKPTTVKHPVAGVGSSQRVPGKPKHANSNKNRHHGENSQRHRPQSEKPLTSEKPVIGNAAPASDRTMGYTSVSSGNITKHSPSDSLLGPRSNVEQTPLQQPQQQQPQRSSLDEEKAYLRVDYTSQHLRREQKRRPSSGQKPSASSLSRRPSDTSVSSRKDDESLNVSQSSMRGKKMNSSSHHGKSRSRRGPAESGVMGEDSERSMSSTQFYEEQHESFHNSGSLDGSKRGLAKGTSRSGRDDFQFQRQGLSPEETARLLEEEPGDTQTLRNLLHSLRNEYESGHGVLVGPVKKLLSEYEHDARILDVACGALWRMATDDVDAKCDIVDSGTIDVVIDAIGKCRYDAEFAEWAMGTVMSVATEVEYKEYVSQRNAIESILETLREYPERSCVFEWSCRCLYVLLAVLGEKDDSVASEKVLRRNVASIEDSDGIQTIIAAMKCHERETVAQQVAVELLWRLLDVADGSATTRIVRKFIGGGIVPHLTRMLKLQSSSAELFDRVTEMLCVVLTVDKIDDSLVGGVVECVPVVIRRMINSPRDEMMQKAGLRILAAVTVLGNVPAPSMQDTVASEAILGALRSLREEPTCLTNGLLVLWKLSSYRAPLLDYQGVIGALEIMKFAIASESYCLENHAAILGFIANISGTPGLELSDLPLRDLLYSKFDNGSQESEEKARSIVSHAMPFICMKFPEFGTEAVEYMADDDFLRHLGDGLFDRVFPLAQTVLAVGANARTSLPEGLSAGIVDALSRTNDRGNQRILINFLVSSITAAGDAVSFPPRTIQTLVNLFRNHQHELDLCDSILNALGHLLIRSPPGVESSMVARAILDYVLSPSVTDDTQERASIALWALLARNPCNDSDILSRIYTYTVKVFERFVGENAEAFDSSLVEVTCGVLCSVASLVRSSPIAISQLEVDTVVSIVYLSMEMERSPAIPCLVLEALYHLCLVNEGVLIQCGAIVVVADAVQKFNRNPAVLEAGFAVLAQLASSENVHINLSIVFSDGVDSLLHGMNQFPDERGIQSEGCKAFSHLSIEGETRMVICEQGGVALIVQSLAAHEGDEALVEYGCCALLNLTSDAPDEAVDGTGIIHCIVSLMERYQRTPSVRRGCLGILQNISMKGAHAKDAIARCGGLVSVIQTIEQQIDSPDVLERAFTTLWSLAVLAENRERIRTAGGIEHVVQAMLSFVEYEGVQQQACGCICTLAMDPTVCETIRSAGGCLSLLYAMRVHYTSIDVQSEAARALSVMYGAESGNRSAEPSTEELDAVLMAMRRFDDDQTIQARGCAALSAFLACSSSSQTFPSKYDEIRRLARKVSSQFPELAGAATHVESLT